MAAEQANSVSGDRLARDGFFATRRPLASVKESLGVPGTGAPERLLTARLYDSLEFEVLPGRGFDIGDTWYRGIPVSWFSPTRDARALPSLTGNQWLSRFTGGLLTTCGLDNIGPATAAQGMHGNIGHLPADEVAWTVNASNDIALSGVIESTALFGASFRVHRTVKASTSVAGAELHIVDTVTNIGIDDAPLSMLYHVNLGAPLIAPGTRVAMDSTRVTASAPHPDVPDWTTLPSPVERQTESVFEHLVEPRGDGFAHASVTSSVVDLAVVVEWSAATLPHLNQWVVPTRGRWALAIEPSSAPLFGPGRDAPHAGAPLLAVGETRSHEIRIIIGPRSVAATATE